jgi:hypothetical protein
VLIPMPSISLVLTAWFVAVACALLSAWHVRKLARLAAPARAELRSRFEAMSGASERSAALVALHEEQRDAERELSSATLWPRSLARISLASGTALAVTSLARGLGSGAGHLPGGMLEFSAGFVGMLVCAAFGRQAKGAATQLRQGWREALRVLARE